MLKLIAAILLFVLVVGRDHIKNHLTGKKASFDGIKDRTMIDSSIERLHEVFGKPFPPFEVPGDVLEIMNREPDSEYAMNIFLQSVAAHCGYNRRAVMLRAFGEKEGMPPGRIQKLGSQFLMELYMNNEENPEGVLAVIIHEFCHFFLYESGISLENTIENEVLTDTAAIYFGFGVQLRAGYKPRLRSTSKGTNMWHRIGYLDTLNIDYVMERIREI